MPPISRTDFPYPLRTIDGEIDVIADSILSTKLDVTGDTNLANLYVSGITTVVGGIIDLADIQCDTINCIHAARFRSTVQVDGVSTLSGGVSTTAINCNNLTATNTVTCANCSLGIAVATTLNTTGGISINSSANATSATTGSIITEGGMGLKKDVFTNGNISSQQLIVGNQLRAVGGTGTTLTIDSDQDASSTTTGAAIVSGGVGVAKNLYVGNIVSADKVYVTGSGQSLYVASNQFASTTTTGAISTNGGAGIVGNIIAGDRIQSQLNQNATSTSNGAIVAASGGISCGQDIVCGGVVKTTSLNLASKNAVDTSGSTLRLNGAGDFANVSISNLTTLNTKPFVYTQGAFTPQLKCLESIGGVLVQNDWVNVTHVYYQEGYFQRVGNVVNVWYNCQIDISGSGNDFAGGNIKLPTITNLPYPSGISFFSNMQDTTWAVTDPSFPNGYAGGVGAPGTILMPYPYEATVLTKNFPFVPQIPPANTYTTQWISDGKTIVFSGDQLQEVLGTIYWESPGNVYNFNILSTGSYTLRFNGMVTYFTDA